MAAEQVTRVLVDTPVWIDHLHRADPALRQLLLDDAVCLAGPVLGELIAGTLPHRTQTIADLRLLPRVPEPDADEVFDWMELNGLGGKGLSWVVSIWTRDRALEQAARRLKLAYATK
jgi:predicted nucleic acid-binding protein